MLVNGGGSGGSTRILQILDNVMMLIIFACYFIPCKKLKLSHHLLEKLEAGFIFTLIYC